MVFPLASKIMPTKLRYKLLVSFCLMSLLPILIGVYIASLFIKFPFEVTSQNMVVITVVTLFSLILSYLGFLITKQMVAPIVAASNIAHKIAEGNLEESADFKGADELEELSRSLMTISHNARELLDKVDKLTLKDKLTGLYNGQYIRERLNEEIQRAVHYQRPCSFAYFSIDNFELYVQANGSQVADDLLKAMAGVFRTELSEFDRAARIGKGEFGIIFFDKNMKKAIRFTESIRSAISKLDLRELRSGTLTVSIGLSENPLDGVSAKDIYNKARDRSKIAAKKGKNLIEAFGGSVL